MVENQTQTQTETTQNRWLVVLAAVVLELALGAIYAWSTFASYLKTEAGWTSTQTQWVFSAGTLALAIAVIFAGKLNEIIGPRKLIILSAAITGGGYILGGFLPLLPIWTTIAVGLIGGAGIGIAYALPISVCSKWFPDKKGLVVGLGMAGFGSGSLIWQYLLKGIFYEAVGISWTFVIYGMCFIVMIMFSYFFLYNPPVGYTVAGYDPSMKKNAGGPIEEINFTSKEILKTPQFYMLFYALMVGSGAGLMVIGIAKIWPQQVLTDLSYLNAAEIATFSAAVIYPLFNGLGRIIWGWLSDKIGWKLSIIIMDSMQTVTFFLLVFLARTPVTLYISMAIIAFNYGANFTVFPMATGEIFGRKYLSSNYGYVFFAFGIGALFGPSLGGIFNDAGNQLIAFIIAGVSLAIGVVLMVLIKPPKKS
jgi:OFA family oxalate/formate antiporter-like MFS transporter